MSSTSETGHAINVANYEKMIAYISTYPEYNPANGNLTQAALNTLLNKAKTTMSDVNAVTSPKIVEVNRRQQAFAPVESLATKLIAALSASQITDRRIVADAQTVARKLQGRRAEAKKAVDPAVPAEEADKYISNSQKSFDNQVEFMDKLIKILEVETGYAPNETELTLLSLKKFHSNLAVANKMVIDTTAAYDNQLIVRQKVLYAPVTGMIDIAKEVKNYLKSLYGASHPSFKQVKAIPFRTVKDRK